MKLDIFILRWLITAHGAFWDSVKWHQIGCITLPDKSNANPIKPRTSLPDIQSHEI